MFKHIYVNSLKIFLREKNTVFWLLLFPMILAIFFKMAFSGLTDDESFEIIPVAVVCDEENEEAVNIYKGILSGLKDMLDITYTDEKGADKLLDEGKISAYLTVEYRENMPMLSMTIKENLINQSIVKEVIDKINEGVRLVMSGSVDENRISDLMNVENVLNNVQLSGEKQDFIAAWFYTILGMAAMYGSLIGLTIIQMIQANQSEEAMRFNLAPASKMKGFSAVFSAGATVHSVNMLLIYLYLRYIMNINFGSRQGYIIHASVIAGITGIAVGAMIGAVLKSGANTKLGICLAVSMLGSYLAGMMDNTMKYRVMQNAPAVEYINPVGILTDAYLKLFYYKDLSYFWWDIVNLLVIMAVCMTVTIFVLRRQRYDNI